MIDKKNKLTEYKNSNLDVYENYSLDDNFNKSSTAVFTERLADNLLNELDFNSSSMMSANAFFTNNKHILKNSHLYHKIIDQINHKFLNKFNHLLSHPFVHKSFSENRKAVENSAIHDILKDYDIQVSDEELKDIKGSNILYNAEKHLSTQKIKLPSLILQIVIDNGMYNTQEQARFNLELIEVFTKFLSNHLDQLYNNAPKTVDEIYNSYQYSSYNNILFYKATDFVRRLDVIKKIINKKEDIEAIEGVRKFYQQLIDFTKEPLKEYAPVLQQMQQLDLNDKDAVDSFLSKNKEKIISAIGYHKSKQTNFAFEDYIVLMEKISTGVKKIAKSSLANLELVHKHQIFKGKTEMELFITFNGSKMAQTIEEIDQVWVKKIIEASGEVKQKMARLLFSCIAKDIVKTGELAKGIRFTDAGANIKDYTPSLMCAAGVGYLEYLKKIKTSEQLSVVGELFSFIQESITGKKVKESSNANLSLQDLFIKNLDFVSEVVNKQKQCEQKFLAKTKIEKMRLETSIQASPAVIKKSFKV